MERRLELAGWLTFLVAGFFFVAAGLEAGSLWGTVGGVLWVLGVVMFLLTLRVRQ